MMTTKRDSGFALFQYSLILFALGAIGGMFLEWADEGLPRGGKWYGLPLVIGSTILLVLFAIAQFISLVQRFK